jgi:succinate dehydrogenase/fumarate reductase flavoprotein subunit
MSELSADVLVIGGGMAAAWAAISAAQEGASVIVVDKGYLGTSGVTATAGPNHWFIPPDPEKRTAAIAQRQSVACGIADPGWMSRILEQTFARLPTLEGFYEFPFNDDGVKQYGPVRGPEYMRALRRMTLSLGVIILDHHPALGLLRHADGSIAGAHGVRRQAGGDWSVRAAGVVLATGGCAFASRLLGSRTNTGDGYLMAAEAGVELSGMEFTSHYTVAPAFSTMARGMAYVFATYYDSAFQKLDLPPNTAREHALARELLKGPVYCDLSLMPQDIRDRLPYISPNVLPPFIRRGINPFTDKFPVTLLAEGTIRGIGGIKIADNSCQTAVPGLFAAGDAASRELVAGAMSGGGSVNSAWALSSGTFAGRGAARRARETVARRNAPAVSLAQAGLHPTRAVQNIDPAEIIKIAGAEATHYDRNYFRTAQKLERSLGMLDGLWRTLSGGLRGEGIAAMQAREAAAILATTRWSFTAALHRRESRGMHTRLDFPDTNPAFEQRQVISGLDHIRTSFETEKLAEKVA